MYRHTAFRPFVVLLIALMLAIAGIKAAQAYSTKASNTGQSQNRILSNTPDSNPAPNCRYGVAALNAEQVTFVDDLGAGWYLDFSTHAAVASNGAEFVRLVTVKQDKTPSGEYLPTYTITPALTDAALGAQVDAAPGAMWIVGNEVDRGPDPGQTSVNQGDTHPDVYARAYHDVYYFIKNRDATARVANSALVQVTPGRLQYLDIMWDTYVDLYDEPMPVDVWNMHLYILPEVNAAGHPNSIANVALGTDPALAKMESYDPDGDGPLTHAATCPNNDVYCFAEHDDMSIFAQQVIAMRRWMNDHGQRNKPLILAEYSILYPYQDDGASCFIQDEYGQCFTPDRVQSFMNDTFSYLETATDPTLGYPADNDRLVQQWLWFSVRHAGVGYVSDLITYDAPPALNALGQNFRSQVQSRSSYTNLYPAEVEPVVAKLGSNTTVNVNLTAWVGNNGTRTANSFKVTFYKDATRTQIIGEAVVPAKSSTFTGMTGCALREIPVSVTWDNLGPGLHRFWVEVDSGRVITEMPSGQDGEADNVASGTVLVEPLQSYLPAITRN